MYLYRSDNGLKRDQYKMSSDAIFCSPLGIQPGIVRQTREKFASDTDCSTIQGNGIISKPELGGSANARLKSTYEGMITTSPTEQRLNAPVRVYRRPPIPNNGLEKVYSSESSLYDSMKFQYFKYDPVGHDKNAVVYVPPSQAGKTVESSMDYNYPSPSSSVAATKSIFENYVASLTSRNHPRIDGRVNSSTSESPTGSFFERESSRNRSFTSTRDQQKFQPPLVTSGKQGFGMYPVMRNTPREPITNDGMMHTEFPKINEEQSRFSMVDAVKGNRVCSWANFPYEKPYHNPLEDSTNSSTTFGETSESSMNKGSNNFQRNSTLGLPFSYSNSPGVLSRQLSLLKSHQGAPPPTSAKTYVSNSYSNANTDFKYKAPQAQNTFEPLYGSFCVASDGKWKQNAPSPRLPNQQPFFIPKSPKMYKTETNSNSEHKITNQNAMSQQIENKKETQSDETKLKSLIDGRSPSMTGGSRGRQRPLSIIENKHPETVQGSALLSSLRSQPADESQGNSVQKRVNKIGQLNNFKTFPGSNIRAKCTLDSRSSLGHSQSFWKARSEVQPKELDNGVTLNDKTGTENNDVKKAFDKNHEEPPKMPIASSKLGKSSSAREPDRTPLFKSSRVEKTNEKPLLSVINNKEEINKTSKDDTTSVTSLRHISPGMPSSPKEQEQLNEPWKDEEPQLTTKQITGILEKKLKFRLHPSVPEKRTSKRTTTLTPSPNDEKQPPFSRNSESYSINQVYGEINLCEPNPLSITEQKYHQKPEDDNNYSDMQDMKVTSPKLNSQEQFIFKQSLPPKGHIKEISQKLTQNLPVVAPASAKSQLTFSMKKLPASEIRPLENSTAAKSTKQASIPPVPPLKGKILQKEMKNETDEDNRKFDGQQSESIENQINSSQPVAFALPKSVLAGKVAPKVFEKPAMMDLKPLAGKKFPQSSNQTIIKRPNFTEIAQKLEEQLKHNSSLTRAQSYILPTTENTTEEPVDGNLAASATNLNNSEERAPEAPPIIRSDRRQKSLTAIEDESLKPVRMQLLRELTETLARRSGNFEETKQPRKALEPQTYRSILRPKSTEANTSNGKPRISFPPDDQLTTTHDYEAETNALKLEMESDGSTSEEEPGPLHTQKAYASSADETEDSTDSAAVNTPFIRRHRKSFPRPKWANKEHLTPTPVNDGTDNGANRHFPRLTTTEIPPESSVTQERPLPEPNQQRSPTNEADIPMPWKPYPAHLT